MSQPDDFSNEDPQTRPLNLAKVRNLPTQLLIGGGAISVLGLLLSTKYGIVNFGLAYLVAYMFCLSLGLGALFLVMARLELTNTLWALILPPMFSAFGIFFLRQHLMTIPHELDEAATIDGAGHLQIFARILVPLSGPALATLGILAFTYWWNDLLLPLVMINDTETQTLPVGLVLLAGRFSTGSLGTIAAGITMAVVPVLIVFGDTRYGSVIGRQIKKHQMEFITARDEVPQSSGE